MTTLRRFKTDDLFRFNEVNLDKLTETYHISFYLQYMAEWPELFTVAEASNGNLMGYGKYSTKENLEPFCVGTPSLENLQ